MDALQPQERVAAALGAREGLDACETLMLRARADLEAGRIREAALQLRIGLEALLAEVTPLPAPSGGAVEGERSGAQLADLAALEERRAMTGEAANTALRGELPPAVATEVAETLHLAERVLRRRRILAG